MIVQVAPRLAPYSFDLEAGELVSNLSLALARLGNQVVLFVPYSQDLAKVSMRSEITLLRAELDDEIVEELWLKSFELAEKVKVYVVGDEKFFTDDLWEGDALIRSDVFCHGVLAAVMKLGLRPKVINGFGWESAALMPLLKGNKDFSSVVSALTISEDLSLMLERQDIVKSFKKSVALADEVILSSSKYAGEIFDPNAQDVLASLLSARKRSPIGILGGLDYKACDPRQDKLIEHNYDEGLIKERPKNKTVLQQAVKLAASEELLLTALGPLHQGNGGELILQALPGLLEQGTQILIAGPLETNLEKSYKKLAVTYPKQLALKPKLDYELFSQVMAGSDLLMSLAQFGSPFLYQILVALRYGCIPLVFASGAAAEIVDDYDPNRETGTGFIFKQYSPWALFATAVRAKELARFPYDWHGLQDNGMQARFFWHETARQYVDLYREAIANKTGLGKPSDDDDDEDDGVDGGDVIKK